MWWTRNTKHKKRKLHDDINARSPHRSNPRPSDLSEAAQKNQNSSNRRSKAFMHLSQRDVGGGGGGGGSVGVGGGGGGDRDAK